MFAAYIFEAKQLQSYIFETSKLRDASGASELLNSFAYEIFSADNNDNQKHDLAGKLLSVARLPADASVVQRRAGGVLVVVVPQALSGKLKHFRTLWCLGVRSVAPGLAFIDALKSGKTAADATRSAYEALAAVAPNSDDLQPLASPLVRLSTRTARAPVPIGRGIEQQKCVLTKDFIDEPTRAKRQFLENSGPILPELFAGEDAKNYSWPLIFDQDEGAKDFDQDEGEKDVGFPFNEGMPKRLAIIHIDGNGVGQVYETAAAKLDQSKIRELSRGLAEATQNAARNAMKQSVLPHAQDGVVPARPVLLGGDDLTIVLRADLALNFTVEFIASFEAETAKVFKRFDVEKLPPHLTAKAGIVFLGVRQPFSQGYDLCEELASHAKNKKYSQVSFVRLMSAFTPSDVPEIQPERSALRRGKWRIDELKSLIKLSEVMRREAIGHGALRRVATLLAEGRQVGAESIYKRGLKVLKDRAPDDFKDLLSILDELGVGDASPVNKQGYSPLLDAHDLAQLHPEQGGG